jgi:hypothetical protein
MKRLIALFIATCLFAVDVIQAQTEKGNFMFGTSCRSRLGMASYTGNYPDIMSFEFSKFKYKSDEDTEEGDKVTSINMIPRVGYFVIKNLAVGLEMQLSYMKYNYSEDDDWEKVTFFGAGPFVRYYIPVGKVYPFIEAGAAFGGITDKDSYDEDEPYKYSVQTYGGGAGLAIPIGKKTTFDTMLGYNSMSLKEKEDNSDNVRVIIGSFGIRFGFHIYLGS